MAAGRRGVTGPAFAISAWLQVGSSQQGTSPPPPLQDLHLEIPARQGVLESHLGQPPTCAVTGGAQRGPLEKHLAQSYKIPVGRRNRTAAWEREAGRQILPAGAGHRLGQGSVGTVVWPSACAQEGHTQGVKDTTTKPAGAREGRVQVGVLQSHTGLNTQWDSQETSGQSRWDQQQASDWG